MNLTANLPDHSNSLHPGGAVHINLGFLNLAHFSLSTDCSSIDYWVSVDIGCLVGSIGVAIMIMNRCHCDCSAPSTSIGMLSFLGGRVDTCTEVDTERSTIIVIVLYLG